MTTVTWTQDGNGNYEVSSANHLKQLMHKGLLYTDAGSPPSSYWAVGTRYIQTSDIDLLSDSSDISPIGIDGDQFEGVYDGGELRISNWSYVDPNFSTSDQCQLYVGLFGDLDLGQVKNIRLDGVWTIDGFNKACGFLLGNSVRSNSTEDIGAWNIQCDFAAGSYIETNGNVDTSSFLGGVVGRLYGPYLSDITLRGSVDFRPSTHAARSVGGVVGGVILSQSMSLVSNFANFPSGIVGTDVGGVAGAAGQQLDGKIEYLVNAMTGDITGAASNARAGGVCGVYSCFLITRTCSHFVNAMTGNITSPGQFTGGIAGVMNSDAPNSHFFNYMTGDIAGTGTTAGGMFGKIFNDADFTLTSSINAMNGSVSNSVVGDSDGSTIVVTVDTSFGLTFTSDSNSTTSPPTDVLFSPDFPELPYAPLIGSTPDGSFERDFVFGNLSGSSNSAYNIYTHCVLHKGDILGPLRVDFDISETNTVLYTTFVSITTEDVLQPGLTVISIGVFRPAFLVSLRPTNILVAIVEVPGAIGYKITHESSDGGEVTAVSNVTTLEHNITGLTPATEYTIRLFADVGSGYDLLQELVATTLTNAAENYAIDDFLQDGVVNLTSLPEITVSNLTAVINELLETGDRVIISLNASVQQDTRFIKVGETLNADNIDGILLPFEENLGAGQNASILLADGATTVAITYDETRDSITLNGVVYFAGDTLVLDGKKVTVFEY